MTQPRDPTETIWQPARQRAARALPGAPVAACVIALFVGGWILIATGIRHDHPGLRHAGIALVVVALLLAPGVVVVAPNESRVLVLFGRYAGTAFAGMWFVNPLTASSRKRLSLRVRNFQSERLKVNDASGNPVELAAIVVWRVTDTARASFDVEDLQQFVRLQSESAIRELASRYPYDDYDAERVSLRRHEGEVLATLLDGLRERLDTAGILVIETRLTHLAYAPEIAEVMLRRQQAEAVLAARKTMVAGAVGLVQMALAQLAESDLVDLDPERKAAMVSNLMVVLSGDHAPAPVLNTGTLY